MHQVCFFGYEQFNTEVRCNLKHNNGFYPFNITHLMITDLKHTGLQVSIT